MVAKTLSLRRGNPPGLARPPLSLARHARVVDIQQSSIGDGLRVGCLRRTGSWACWSFSAAHRLRWSPHGRRTVPFRTGGAACGYCWPGARRPDWNHGAIRRAGSCVRLPPNPGSGLGVHGPGGRSPPRVSADRPSGLISPR